MERRPAVGSKCGVGILHVCQVKTITKNVPTIILTVHLRTWLIISRKLSLCDLFWTTLYIALLAVHTNQKLFQFQCGRPRQKRALPRVFSQKFLQQLKTPLLGCAGVQSASE